MPIHGRPRSRCRTDAKSAPDDVRWGADLSIAGRAAIADELDGTSAATVARVDYEVVEAARMNARSNRGLGKSDPLDAHRIAAAVLPLDSSQLRRPRLAEGVRAALRVLIASRDHMTAERTATVNALIALLRVVDLGIDARQPLTRTQISTVARWRSRDENLGTATARAEAIRVAKRVVEFDEQIAANSARMSELVRAAKPRHCSRRRVSGP